MSKKIKLTQGQYTEVDDEDYGWLMMCNWYADYNKIMKCYYAKGRLKESIEIKMHRAIMEHHLGRKLKKNEDVDHINHDTLKNTKDNLRVVSHHQNMQNRKKEGTSKYPGVHWVKRDKRWQARLYVNKKSRHLGYFKSEESAAKAYEMACRLCFNENIVYKIGNEPSYKTSKFFTPLWEIRKDKKSSKYVGVTWDKTCQKWRAYISIDRKNKSLGVFMDEEDAYKAVLKAKGVIECV